MSGIIAASVLGVSSWTPKKLGAALIGWYKADAGVFSDAGLTPATNGQSAQQWNDQSGNGNNLTQSVSSAQPTFNTGIQNGKPGLTFASANSQLMTTGTLSLGGTTASIFCVAKGSTPGNSARLFAFQATGDPNDFGTTTSATFAYFNNSTTVQAFRNSAPLSTGTVTDSTFNEIGSIFDGANNTLYINNTAQAPSMNANTFGATGVLWVAGSSGGNDLNGVFLEIIVTKSAISSADRTNIHTYFTNKWGI